MGTDHYHIYYTHGYVLLQQQRNRRSKKSMFCLFTLSCSAMVGVSAQYAPEIILNATITLFVIVGFVNIYAYNTAKRGKDFTSLWPTLMGFLVMIITLAL